MPVMGGGRPGFRRRGFRRVCVYLDWDTYISLVMHSKREGKTMSEVVMEAIRKYLGGGVVEHATGRVVAQEAVVAGGGDSNGGLSTTQLVSQPTGQSADWLVDNPWIEILRKRKQY